jgi:hypothetical protein
MINNLIFLMMIISLVMTSVITISDTQQTVYAEKDDDNNEDELSESDVAVLCGASEDYQRNQEQCDNLYDMLEEGIIKDDPDFEYN